MAPPPLSSRTSIWRTGLKHRDQVGPRDRFAIIYSRRRMAAPPCQDAPELHAGELRRRRHDPGENAGQWLLASLMVMTAASPASATRCPEPRGRRCNGWWSIWVQARYPINRRSGHCPRTTPSCTGGWPSSFNIALSPDDLAAGHRERHGAVCLGGAVVCCVYAGTCYQSWRFWSKTWQDTWIEGARPASVRSTHRVPCKTPQTQSPAPASLVLAKATDPARCAFLPSKQKVGPSQPFGVLVGCRTCQITFNFRGPASVGVALLFGT